MTDRLLRLSRQVAHALRHRPEDYGLALDGEGWVGIEELLAALARSKAVWATARVEDLHAMIAAADKQRFEIAEGRIRALYGHSTAETIEKPPAVPPKWLYHGTTASAAARIRAEGLRPMDRQYVHLSPDLETAKTVALRRTASPVIVTVRAAEAHAAGVTFHYGNDQVWLSGSIAPTHLAFPTDESG